MTVHIHSPEMVADLENVVRALRIESLRMIYRRGQGHPGGTLSAAEAVAALYFHHLRIRPEEPDWEERDRFIMSKGHASAILYAALARRGYFPEAELETWGNIGGRLQGHPDRLKTPGVDMSTGCLGHGISIGAGLCLAARARGMDFRTTVLIGDGECQSGVVWEGVMLAAKYGLGDLTVILDYNQVQLDGRVEEIMPFEPVRDKWLSFNWAVLEIDGHNMLQVLDALDEADSITGRPVVILSNTVKGKGVSFMEHQAEWHGRAPSEDEYRRAIEELAGL